VARTPKTQRVTIDNVKQEIDCADGETILHAALLAGIDFPYACASGNCGTCICHLDAGKVSLLPRSDASLTPEQVKAGQTLACRARPHAEVTVTWLGRGRR
jgi:ferredoxin